MGLLLGSQVPCRERGGELERDGSVKRMLTISHGGVTARSNLVHIECF